MSAGSLSTCLSNSVSDEDEGVADAAGEARDRDALDQLVRVALHELAVLEGPGLGFVGVAAEVLVLVAVRQEGDLLAHREAGAAASAKSRFLEFVDNRVQFHLGVGLLRLLPRRRVRLHWPRKQRGVGKWRDPAWRQGIIQK